MEESTSAPELRGRQQRMAWTVECKRVHAEHDQEHCGRPNETQKKPEKTQAHPSH